MTDPAYTSIEDYIDVEALNAYQALQDSGLSAQEAFAVVHAKARDNSRTPMQWDDSQYAGFSTVEPWLRPTGHDRVNVASETDNGRILPYYRQLIAMRKQLPVIAEGLYSPWALEDPDVLCYVRSLPEASTGPRQVLVACSFRGQQTRVALPDDFEGGRVLIGNTRAVGQQVHAVDGVVELGPYEALAVVPADTPGI